MANRFFEGAVHAASYAKFRPQPPASLIDRVLTFLKEKYQGPFTAAIDVGCGSGQSTHILSPHFTSVTGLDISQAQITEATKLGTGTNVFFKVSGAEKLPFSECSLQLVTAGQACHWFDLPKFYEEVDRILVPGGVLALYGYAFPQPIYGDLTEKLYDIINYVYSKELGPYWGTKITMVDDEYGTVQTPFPTKLRCMKKTRVATGEVVVKMLMLLIAIKSSAYLTQVIQG
ncbi:putative methyltransferase DDB_G0268948 isoform X2 [Homarus americanus]|uniref:Methyltransferase-like 2 n=1 Tax=Homarus americanus TaxID=6706 RepID=A0A8J5MUN6_HOMAM|nr:putative methyltransferase DDB_G0268948 isoform X2 [Homarus americanus]KAG7164708.1 methyltransferase-like 2 [Homarus americanus]